MDRRTRALACPNIRSRDMLAVFPATRARDIPRVAGTTGKRPPRAPGASAQPRASLQECQNLVVNFSVGTHKSAAVNSALTFEVGRFSTGFFHNQSQRRQVPRHGSPV